MNCRVCRSKRVGRVLDCGDLPLTNRFLRSPEEAEPTFPIALSQCEDCGAIQLEKGVPVDELRPRFDWITYNEPEGHLDRVAEHLASLPGVSPSSRVCGISFKDDSLLARFRSRGFPHVHRLDPAELGMNEANAGNETLQAKFTRTASKRLAEKHGKFDLVIARHIVEHAYDLDEFLDALKEWVAPGGYLVMEAPDCSRAMRALDFSTIWEEHLLYFTATSYARMLIEKGIPATTLDSYPYAMEDCLVSVSRVVGQKPGGLTSTKTDLAFKADLELGSRLGSGLEEQRGRVRAALSRVKSTEGPIALFGAGHLGAMYVNLLKISDLVSFVVDDNPNKKSLFLPGSRLPIFGSSALLERKVKLALLCLSPESEEKVIERNQSFVEAGGRFASIFPLSGRNLKV